MDKDCFSYFPVIRTAFCFLITLGVSCVTFAQSLAGITLNPSTVVSGSNTTGTIKLTSAAPSGGLNVVLTSSLTEFAYSPSSVTVPAGSVTATFPVSTVAHSRTLISKIVAATATSSQSAELTALGDGIAGISVAPSTIVGGQQGAIGTVTLLYPAPSFGWTVHLSSSLPSFVSVPAAISIPAGSSTGTFSISTTLYATISARDQTTSGTANLTDLGDGILSLTLSPSTVVGGQATSTGTVTLLHPAPAFGWSLKLSSTSYATAPSSVDFAEGATTATFTISTTA